MNLNRNIYDYNSPIIIDNSKNNINNNIESEHHNLTKVNTVKKKQLKAYVLYIFKKRENISCIIYPFKKQNKEVTGILNGIINSITYVLKRILIINETQYH